LEDYNNRTTRWTNLFEDESNQTELNYLKLAQLCIDFENKQKHNPPYMIRSNNEIELAREFAGENEIEWSKEQHVEIIATMLMIKKGDKLFQLAPGYLQKFIQDDLNKKKAEDNYKQEIVEAISLNNSMTQHKLDKAKAKIGRRTTNNNEIKSLTAANQELLTLNEQLKKDQEKLKKKMKIMQQRRDTHDKYEHRMRVENKTLTEELYAHAEDLFNQIKGQLEEIPIQPDTDPSSWRVLRHKYLSMYLHSRGNGGGDFQNCMKIMYDKGIAEWRAQGRKPYEPPPADAKVEQPTPTTTEAMTDAATDWAAQPEAVRQPVVVRQPEQNRKILHSCGKCDGCSDQTRADCARDNNLDPFVVAPDRPKKRQKVYHESGNEDDGQDY
jgi:hypothetical protein